jgi:hypothetical protein
MRTAAHTSLRKSRKKNILKEEDWTKPGRKMTAVELEQRASECDRSTTLDSAQAKKHTTQALKKWLKENLRKRKL